MDIGSALFDTTFLVGVTDGDPVESNVFLRGNHLELSTEAVPHRYFSALSEEALLFDQTNSGRLDLANVLTQPNHPLTARVMANRVWHHLFGRGIVETVDNFGLQGKIPTHPELLDHLAIYFVENDWSIKKLIRYILLSETFQRSTANRRRARRERPAKFIASSLSHSKNGSRSDSRCHFGMFRKNGFYPFWTEYSDLFDGVF